MRFYALIAFGILWALIRIINKMRLDYCWMEDSFFAGAIETDWIFYPFAFLELVILKSLAPLCVCCILYVIFF